MTTLADLVYQTASALNIVSEGTGTGGSAGPPVTLVDANGLTEADDYWNEATCIVLYDAGGAGAAPQGQFSPVADYVLTSHTLTMKVAPEPVLTTAPASGDRYALAAKRYPLDKIIQCINMALNDLGLIPYTDTSLTTAASQTEYTLPTALANLDLRQVWEQTVTSDSNDNQWRQIYDWYLTPPAIGSPATLILPQLTTGHKLMLVYNAYHPTLRVCTDKLSELVYPPLVVYPAALKCLMWYKAKTEETGTYFNEQINYIQSKIDEARRMFPLRLPPRHSRILVIGNEDLPL